MQRVESRTPTAVSRQRSYIANPRPEAIANWTIVSSIEAILLIALAPALIHRFGSLGWGALLLGVVMAGLSSIWYQGIRLGYMALVVFYIFSFISLIASGILFLLTQPLVPSLIFVALVLITAGAFARRDRRAGAILAVIAIIYFVILFASASSTQQAQLNRALLLFGFYLLTGGAASFIFNVRWGELRKPLFLRFFGYDSEPPALLAVATLIARINALLSTLYSAATGLFRPIGRTVTGGNRAFSRGVDTIPAGPRRLLTIVLVVLGLFFFPLLVRWLETVTNLSLLITMNVGLLFVVLALGLNIVVGFAGLLDLGYAAFFAIGAYTLGVFTWPTLGLEWSFWIVIWLSALVAAIFGIIIGTPTLRLRGDYLAIVTLAFGEIVPRAIREMSDITLKIPFTDIYLIGSELAGFNLTNGTRGMNPVGRPMIFGHEVGIDPLTLGPLTISPPMQWYFLIILVGALVLVAALRLENSRLGRAWMAIREDETVADAMGVNLVRTKLAAFALGASFSGFAGSIYAAMIQAIFPELFSFLVSIFLLIIVIVSGMGNIWGVLMGGLIISLFDRVALAQIVPEYIPGGDVLQKWRWVMYAAGLIVIMVMRPEGLFPSKARQAELHENEESGLDEVAYIQGTGDGEPTGRSITPPKQQPPVNPQRRSKGARKRKR